MRLCTNAARPGTAIGSRSRRVGRGCVARTALIVIAAAVHAAALIPTPIAGLDQYLTASRPEEALAWSASHSMRMPSAGTVPVARSSNPPRFSGAEKLTLGFVRSALLRDGQPRLATRKAEQVLEDAGDSRSHGPSVGGVGGITVANAGRAALWRNWPIAAVLGRAHAANTLRIEADALKAAVEAKGDVEFDTCNPTDKDEGPIVLSVFVRAGVSEAGAGLAAMSDACDPEGFIRQRLQHVYDDMLNFAESVRALGELWPACALLYEEGVADTAGLEPAFPTCQTPAVSRLAYVPVSCSAAVLCRQGGSKSIPAEPSHTQ